MTNTKVVHLTAYAHLFNVCDYEGDIVPKTILFEENEDGTTTITMNLDGYEFVSVIAMTFDQIAGSFSDELRSEASEIVADNSTLIPMFPEGFEEES